MLKNNQITRRMWKYNTEQENNEDTKIKPRQDRHVVMNIRTLLKCELHVCGRLFLHHMCTHIITVVTVKPRLQKPLFPLLWFGHAKIKQAYQRLQTLHNSLHLRGGILLVSFEFDHEFDSERLSVYLNLSTGTWLASVVVWFTMI